MKTNKEKDPRRQRQGAASKAQGKLFEDRLDAAFARYRESGFAIIEKTPEPMQPIKDLGGGKFIAHYTSTAQADFKGFLKGGRAVNFEAKYTATGKMPQDRVTKDQAGRLERAHQYGAYAFVLCSFGVSSFYRIPWAIWRDLKAHYGHKYITPQEAAPFQIRIGGPGVLLFLEGLEGQF